MDVWLSPVSDFVQKQQIVQARLTVHGVHHEDAPTQQAQQRQHPNSHCRKPRWHIPGPLYTFEPYSLELTVSEKERNSNGFLSADLTESAGMHKIN